MKINFLIINSLRNLKEITINKYMESITVQNGENFVFPKVNILENGELSFEIEKEEPSVEIEKEEPIIEIEKEEPIIEIEKENSIVEIEKEEPIVKDKPKKDCIKYITSCTAT